MPANSRWDLIRDLRVKEENSIKRRNFYSEIKLHLGRIVRKSL
jgi:hypothetical protein